MATVDPKKLIVFIPDTRGVTVSRYGKGNLKIGPDVYTYSRLPGHTSKEALSSAGTIADHWHGTCPGATEECQQICYAARPVAENGIVAQMWVLNSIASDVPPIPEDCRLLRIHVSGDFDTTVYIENWIQRLTERPDVRAWAYTRSWRVDYLLPALERLRALPNIQLFASMDSSTVELPPTGWRRAWIDGDTRAGDPQLTKAHMGNPAQVNLVTYDGTMSFVCPEEYKAVRDCQQCRYCTDGKSKDVTFLKH